jgi:hypothetical protein
MQSIFMKSIYLLTLTLGLFVSKLAQSQCNPSVEGIVVQQASYPDSTVSDQMGILFSQDQKARTRENIDWTNVSLEDAQRRIEVLNYLKDTKLFLASDFYRAAFIFQHGNCPEHYKLTNDLAVKAIELGHQDAKWVYAVSLDRYLISLGKPQKFGTQYTSRDGCTYILEPLDPATTDDERAAYDVPSLAEAEANAKDFGNCKN